LQPPDSYFDDPESVPGLAHFLEHAVHLGSSKYPDDRDYKAFLAEHGGASNASTSECARVAINKPFHAAFML
jgi:secreted Zn-dependent insulinase-like peptidase